MYSSVRIKSKEGTSPGVIQVINQQQGLVRRTVPAGTVDDIAGHCIAAVVKHRPDVHCPSREVSVEVTGLILLVVKGEDELLVVLIALAPQLVPGYQLKTGDCLQSRNGFSKISIATAQYFP